MSQPYTKDILNSLYHSVITTGLAVPFSIIGTKMTKLDVSDPAKPDLGRFWHFTEFGKLTLVIFGYNIGCCYKRVLVNSKLIPDHVINIK